MAVVTVDTDLNQTVGVPYTVITDTSSDWPNVGNSIYFFDKEDKLVHYKNASGIVISTYSGGSNISTSNLTSDGSYGLDLNGNTLVLGGTSVIASEGISLQKDTLIKGSDTSASTTGFKVTDSANVSLLDIKNNGKVDFNSTDTFSINNGTKSIGVSNWVTHTQWDINNGSNAWTLLSANASSTFNQDEFGISFNGSSTVPFRIFGGDKIALGNVSKANLDTNYSVNVKDGLNLLDGDLRINLSGKLDIQTGTGQTIQTDASNTYPSFYFDNGVTKYQFGNAKVSGTFNEGDFFIYNSTTTKSNFLITKTGETIISNGATAVIGSEDISLQGDTLVKGSNNSASTSGFKVTDVNNLSLLDIKNDGVVTITRPASATTNSALMIDSSASGVGAGGIQINQGASNYGLTVFGDNNSIIHTFKNAAGINGMTIGSNSIEGYLLGVYNNGASLGGGMFLNSSFQSSGGSYGGIGLGYGTDIGVISGLDKDIIFYMTSTKLHSFKSTGEVVIGSTSSNTSAKLQVDSTTQGFAGPRMTTTERNAISTPLAGLEVYDTTLNSKMIYNGTSWDSLLPGGGGSGTKVLVKGAMGANQVVNNTIPIVEFVDSGTPAGGAIDINGEWDNTNHRFTVGASGAGTYFIQSQIFLNNGSGWSTLFLYKNGAVYSPFAGFGTASGWDNLDGTIPIDLVVGDYIDIRIYSSASGTIDFNNWADRQSFSIAKVSAVAPTAGTDVNALHTNISGEITALTAKATPTTSDVLVIEDAADSNNKKKSTLASIKNTVAPILTKTLTLEAPTASDDITIFKTDRAITVQEVIAVNVGTSPSTTYQLKYNAARNNAGTALTTSSSTTSVVGGNVATLSNASIPADNWVWLETSAASGTNVFLTIDIRYTED